MPSSSSPVRRWGLRRATDRLEVAQCAGTFGRIEVRTATMNRRSSPVPSMATTVPSPPPSFTQTWVPTTGGQAIPGCVIGVPRPTSYEAEPAHRAAAGGKTLEGSSAGPASPFAIPDPPERDDAQPWWWQLAAVFGRRPARTRRRHGVEDDRRRPGRGGALSSAPGWGQAAPSEDGANQPLHRPQRRHPDVGSIVRPSDRTVPRRSSSFVESLVGRGLWGVRR